MKKNVGANIALVAVFAALIAAFSLMPPLFAVAGVPFAIQLVIVLLAPLVLGPRQGALAALLYVVAGVAGLPVFAGQRSGVAVLLGATGGYLIGYVLSAVVVGLVASLALRARRRGAAEFAGLALAAALGVVMVHACGVAGLMLAGNKGAGMAFGDAVIATSAFLPLDFVKAILATVIAGAILRAFPRLRALHW